MYCEVIKNTELTKDYFLMKLENPQVASGIKPGQFVTVKLPQEVPGQRLSIPISIYKKTDTDFTIFVKILGEGTRLLSKVKSGVELDVKGPLGNGFTVNRDMNVLFVTGGVGYPPLNQLKEELINCNVHWVHGGRCADDVFPCDYAYTEDGSKGKKGFVTQDLDEIIEKNNIEYVYACGPKAMLKAVNKIIEKHNIPFEVSLEEYMACGIGVCYGCAVEVLSDDGMPMYKRVCAEGPVFNAKKIVWESI